MNRKEVMELFNRRPRNLLLATSDRKGRVNVAVYGSPKMTDEETIILATRECRSYQNLRENPQAAMFISETGEIGHATKGLRVYLELVAAETEGRYWKDSGRTWHRGQGKRRRRRSARRFDSGSPRSGPLSIGDRAHDSRKSPA